MRVRNAGLHGVRRRKFLGTVAGVAAGLALTGGASGDGRAAPRRVVFLDDSEAGPGAGLEPFRQALRAAGLPPERVAVQVAQLPGSDLRALRRELGRLVKGEPDAFVTSSTPVALNGLPFMLDTPLVVATEVDPVLLGLDGVAGRRRYNVTGFTYHVPLELKSLEVMSDAFPRARRVAVVADRMWIQHLHGETNLAQASLRFGMTLDLVIAASPRDIDWEFDRILRNRADACFVPRSDVLFHSSPALIDFFSRQRMPNLFAHEGRVREGGLLSYGPRAQSQWRSIAGMLRSILGGVAARELPFERPKDFLLGVNATQAARMGIRLPKSILRRASFVV
jgi:putative ABC transport system substrate-binding protein